MSYYNKVKKLDLESLEQLQEGTGQRSDKCICSLLSPPEDEKGRLSSMGASIKKAFGFRGGRKSMRMQGMKSVDIPLTFTKGNKGIFTTREVVKRKNSCGKCGCDSDKLVLKHSFANIRIISPDVSSICPCPSDCLPEKTKLANNIRVTVEHARIDPDIVDSEFSITDQFPYRQIISEPIIRKKSISDLIDQQYECEEDQWSKWSFEDDED